MHDSSRATLRWWWPSSWAAPASSCAPAAGRSIRSRPPCLVQPGSFPA